MTRPDEHSDYYYDGVEVDVTSVFLRHPTRGDVDLLETSVDLGATKMEVTVLAPIAGVGRWVRVPPPRHVFHRSVGSALRAWANRPWQLKLSDVRPKPR